MQRDFSRHAHTFGGREPLKGAEEWKGRRRTGAQEAGQEKAGNTQSGQWEEKTEKLECNLARTNGRNPRTKGTQYYTQQ